MSKNRQELGRVGHFVDGINCRFFRHTHINNVYCVSTIGDYWPTKHKQEPLGLWFGDKNLGDWRYYETRVFNLLDEAKRWVDSDFLFSLKIDGRDYINEKDALEGHEKIVTEYEGKIGIKNQDSEQDNPWILCSERLPKKDGYYLVTVKLKDCIDAFCFVLEDEFLNGEWKNHKKEMVVSWKNVTKPDRKSVKIGEFYKHYKIFKKPNPPKHQLFDLKFIPFSESLPTKNGKYLLYNKENGKWDPWRIDNHKALSMLNHYNRYTHWALVSEEK